MYKRLRCEAGNTSVVFALAMIPLVMVVSMAVDYANSVRIRTELQAAVDAGVLAAATAIANGQDDKSKRVVAQETFFANLSEATANKFDTAPVTTVDLPSRQVSMIVEARNTAMMSRLLANYVDFRVRASAVVDDGDPICLMTLDRSAKNAFSINGTADIVAEDCAAHVNSNHSEALRQVGNATATAVSFCVRGGYTGANFSPTPQANCRFETDPLDSYVRQAWAGVQTSVCDYQSGDMFSNGGGSGETVLLREGVYCGDLNIRSGDVAILQTGRDGVYVFVDGGISIRGGGTLRNYVLSGDGVTPDAGESFPSETTILFTGQSPGVLEVNGGGNLEVRAGSEGDFAGIAIATEPGTEAVRPHLISGGGRVNVTGIIYLPEQELSIRGNGIIGDLASQFAIMANTIDVRGSGRLEIRVGADYQAAGLPKLPEAAERVRLIPD